MERPVDVVNGIKGLWYVLFIIIVKIIINFAIMQARSENINTPINVGRKKSFRDFENAEALLNIVKIIENVFKAD